METIIRKLNHKDLDSLQEISRTTFLESYLEFIPDAHLQNYMETHFVGDEIRKALLNTNSKFFFAERGSEVMGYLKVNVGEAQTTERENAMEIERIYVLSQFHGKGVGRLLFEKAITLANLEDKSIVWLGVFQINSRAIQFYEKNGMKRFGTQDFDMGGVIYKDFLMKIELGDET